MGTRAYWLSSRWRYAVRDEDGDLGSWIYAHTLRDVMSDIEGAGGRAGTGVRIQQRTGRKSEGYAYIDHSVYTPKQKES